MKNSVINFKFLKRKILIVFVLLLFSVIAFGSKNSTVIRTFENKFPQDKFYFIQGLEYKFDLTTSIRYRGILYSDRLEKMGYPFGLELALEGGSDGSEYLENYESMLVKIEVDKFLEKKMKEIFGAKSVLNNNQPLRIGGYYWILNHRGKKVPFEEKSGAYSTIVNVFVDDFKNIDKEEFFKKTYKFGKFLYDEMNILTYLQVYVRDNAFFEDYNSAAYQVYPPFRNREDIKKILEKIRNKQKITEQEKIALTKVFYKSIDFQYPTIDFLLFFNRKPLGEYDNAELYIRDTEHILDNN